MAASHSPSPPGPATRVHSFIPDPPNLHRQSVALPGTARPGSSPIYRNALTSDRLITCSPLTSARTAYDIFWHSARSHPTRPCLGHRTLIRTTPTRAWSPYQWQTYEAVAERITNFGSGLVRLHEQLISAETAKQWHLGIYAINRPEWTIADAACHAYSLVSVALYDTLGPDALEFIITHAETPVVIASGDRVMNLIRVRDRCPGLRVIVAMDEVDGAEAVKRAAADAGVVLVSMAEVEDMGRTNPAAHRPPAPEDLATIMYTSGTTGNPKGAMITHGNLASQNIMHYYRGRGHAVDDVHLSYLPLAHCYERTVALQVLGGGARIAFSRGDPTLLLDDIRTASPTVLPTVPRLLNRIYAKVRAMTIDHPGERGALFRRAVAEKTAHLESGNGVKHPLWDSLLFDAVRRAVMGDRIRVISSGSAPLHPDVQSLLRVVFACDLMQGYGQTECAAIAATQMLGETGTGQVGPVFPSLECKLVDVPELGYRVTDRSCARGEICLRGPAVMIGYWKDAEKTKETIDADGWLHTGDIGAIDDRGCLAIIDRKKSQLKLAQGEYVAPEKLENTYTLSPLVQQIFVHGDAFQSQLVAIVVPEPAALVTFARSRLAIDSEDVPALCRDPKVVAVVLGALTVLGREKRLAGFEMVKAIHLEPVAWTPASGGIMTPSFKLRRPQAVAKYRKVIDALYAQLAAERSSADRLLWGR
ncbi:hypothetical protein AMAG_12669 [Allomyces macrogynus ATCC 38327]|uniref:AMP-dependent synthetase/ligase domain-containing protein n=1 Tax=Allomyces macrogynus (strain ATCC 38327) TaxID=578462 RepID=A0A0L0T128_ALLM3|nr:hypothetical protein AMAG_12669 [Allomyces macrogynus ATCC 38327]|eukprot:KNE68493.1 hypothetical protein AMAG_12669 [Allomyces macrogynus ATCC 38327]